MTGDVDDVVDAPGYPEVLVLVAPGPVAGEVRAGAEPAEVGLNIAVGVVVEGAEHARPRPGQGEQAAALPDLTAQVVDQGGRHAGQRETRRSRLGRDQAGQRG